MAVVTAAEVEAEARTPGAVEVSTAVALPLVASAAAVVIATDITGGVLGSAVGDRPRALAVPPVPQAVQVPGVHGLGKVRAPATHPPDGISSHPATLGP